MKIYTKKGDAGETSLYGGGRVSKDDLRIRAYGTFDELNSALGVILATEGVPAETAERLLRVQSELFHAGAELATPRGKQTAARVLVSTDIERLEGEIDAMEGELRPLKAFILPGGSRASAFIHLARTISRRAERELVTLNRAEPQRAELLQYMNRLSDYLFVTGRYANHRAGVADVEWKP